MARRRLPITIGELREKLRVDPNSLTVDELKAARELDAFKKAGAADSDTALLVDRKTAAELLGVSVMNVDKLTQGGKLAKVSSGKSKGKIEVREVCRLLREWKDGRVKNPENGLTESRRQMEEEAARYRRLKADLAQIEFDVQAGNLVRKEKVEASSRVAGQLLQGLVGELKARLPESLAGMDLRECAATLERELDGVMKQFSEQLTKVAG